MSTEKAIESGLIDRAIARIAKTYGHRHFSPVIDRAVDLARAGRYRPVGNAAEAAWKGRVPEGYEIPSLTNEEEVASLALESLYRAAMAQHCLNEGRLDDARRNLGLAAEEEAKLPSAIKAADHPANQPGEAFYLAYMEHLQARIKAASEAVKSEQ